MGCPRASWLHPRRSWHFAVWTRRSRSRQNNRYYTRIGSVFPEKPRLPAQLHNSPAQIDSWWLRNESGLSDAREWIFGRMTNESGFSPTFSPDTGQKWEIIHSQWFLGGTAKTIRISPQLIDGDGVSVCGGRAWCGAGGSSRRRWRWRSPRGPRPQWRRRSAGAARRSAPA